ncbi:AraC family transcriptional regulator [Gallaecimonas mangrovi]|uniref:AraC family transcriptional regulator n=1 Tax=Gallaecimonas mangrovi TaxID=2291597 RepID=UPI000E208B5C|nr:AraC family transcriptional regulator [Gallaecimonas mangrovi]
MDPLSEVLSLLKPQSYLSGAFDLAGPWHIAFPDQLGAIKCCAVVKGQCWLAVEGEKPIQINAGEAFLLPSGPPFRMGSDLALPATAASDIFSQYKTDWVTTVAGGGEFLSVSCRFNLEKPHADLLQPQLPAIIHIPKEADGGTLRWAMEKMIQELTTPQPGGYLMLHHQAHMILLEALRRHLDNVSQRRVGWFFALADKQLRTAINAIHQAPAKPWTLAELASEAAMSRSTFALKFKTAVGASPMEYLTRWRMLLAGDRLRHSREPVSSIALALGYASESAFSTAFKRTMGCSPRQFTAR